jgi:hypothetical protein
MSGLVQGSGSISWSDHLEGSWLSISSTRPRNYCAVQVWRNMRISVRTCHLGLVASLTMAGSCAGKPGDNEFRIYGPINVRSSGDSQLSTAVYSINVRTAGKLEVSYTAPRLHCASLRMHFLVDGVEKTVSAEVAPGHRTGYVDLGPVTPGNHVVALQAEGVRGGCNQGKITAWEGSAEVWTTLNHGDHSSLRANDLGQIVFEVAHEHYGDDAGSDGIYVTDDGEVYRYRFESGNVPWSPHPHADGEFAEADLLEKYAHGAELLGRVAATSFAGIKNDGYRLSSRSSPPKLTAIASDNGAIPTDQTTLRVYRRNYANGDYEVVLIAAIGAVNWTNDSDAGVRLRAWLEGLTKPGGYQPVPHIFCVMMPCPQPESPGATHSRDSNQQSR